MLENKIQIIYKEVSSVFKNELKDFKVFIVDSKEKFNKMVGRETEKWLIGTKLNKTSIVLLDPLVWSSDQLKYQNFDKVIKHEIVHLFVDQEAGYCPVPRWLHEGLAIAIAGQLESPCNLSIPENFCKQLTGKGWAEMVKEGGYQMSGLFVQFLINNFGFQKILDLLQHLDKEFRFDDFEERFKDVFKFPLGDLEKRFKTEIDNLCK